MRPGLMNMAKGAVGAAFSTGAGYEPQPLGSQSSYEQVAGYFVDFRCKTAANLPSFVSGRGVILPPAPTTIAQRALGWWERHLGGEEGALDRFLLDASRLRALAAPSEGLLLWPYELDFAKYGLQRPWYSAMAQGQAASVFVRAYLATGSDTHAEASHAAIGALSEGRLAASLVTSTRGGPVLEEYTSEPRCHVLNGWMYALWGVWDVATGLGSGRERSLFEASAEALRTSIDLYDTGWWTLYSLYPGRNADLAKPFYHRVHVVQAAAMHGLTGFAEFREAEQRWRGYDRRRNVARAVATKATHLVAA